MKSFRLDPDLEQRLEEAARLTGQPLSQIIREAVRKRCDEIAGDKLSDRLADVVGAIACGGGQSRRTGRDFAESLKAKRSRRRGRKRSA